MVEQDNKRLEEAISNSPQAIEERQVTFKKMYESDKPTSGNTISKEDQEHLFSSFFRGKNALNIQGTGLGLHIVKRYLDVLGGEVHVTSELQKGTTISLTLPVKQI